ncbi:unnamed protein product [Laminaria digitata]
MIQVHMISYVPGIIPLLNTWYYSDGWRHTSATCNTGTYRYSKVRVIEFNSCDRTPYWLYLRTIGCIYVRTHRLLLQYAYEVSYVRCLMMKMPRPLSRISFRVGFESIHAEFSVFYLVFMYFCRVVARLFVPQAARLARTLFALTAAAVDAFTDCSSGR